MVWVFIGIGLVLAGLFIYWLLVTTEGVFLGRRVVVWLYDRTAHRYDRIKEFDPADERYLVTIPILEMLGDRRSPLLLDVATGTGRVPHDLLADQAFTGRIIGLDASRPMLEVAVEKLTAAITSGQLLLVQVPAGQLPFPAQTFDAVSCLEALEFFPSDEIALREMVRVLKPGGCLITTRRAGLEGKWFLHRYRPETEFLALLKNLGLRGVRTYQWEVGYNLVTGRLPQAVAWPNTHHEHVA